MSTGGFNLNQLRTARLLEMWHAELESVQKGMLPDARISRELFRRVAFLKRDISSDRVAQNSEGRLAHDGLFSLHHDQFSGWIRRISPDFPRSDNSARYRWGLFPGGEFRRICRLERWNATGWSSGFRNLICGAGCTLSALPKVAREPMRIFRE